MKQYKTLYSFGCSFTEGGGLNSRNYHNYLNNIHEVNNELSGLLPEHIEYANYHSFPGYLSRFLQCNFHNFGKSRASNTYIFKTAYECISKLSDLESTLITIQTSNLNRILIRSFDLQQEYNINNFDNKFIEDKDVRTDADEFYKLFVTRFFDEQYEFKKLCRNIDIFSGFCKSKNLDVVFLLYNTPIHYHDRFYHKNLLTVDDYKDVFKFAYDKKLLIKDLPNCKYNDPHLSPKGNEEVAKLIIDHLNKYESN
jgi:hypothetical protein